METLLKRVSYWVVAITLPVVILFYSLEFAAFNQNFYIAEYEKYNVSKNTGIEQNELMEITDALLSYLKGEREDLEVYGKVFGSERLIFDERDQAHMVDVRDLFLKGFALKRLLLILLVNAFVYLLVRKHRIALARTVLRSSLISIGTVLLLGLIISTDFSKYFDIFHYIFFDNDLWRLDPQRSILINLVPLGFFMDIVLRIAMYFFGCLGASIVLSTYYLKRKESCIFK